MLIKQLILPPPVLCVCLKAHNVDTFNVHPTVEVVVDGQPKLLPEDVGEEPKDGKKCLRVIHTDDLGNKVHIQYVGPVRLTMGDFLKVYSNDRGVPTEQLITFEEYEPRYSYYSENKQFIQVSNASTMPTFTDDMVVRYELLSK